MALSWSIRTSSFGLDDIYDVCWSELQQKWVAVGSSNKIATSLDGVNWTQQTSPFSFGFNLSSVNFSPSLNQWLIVEVYYGVATSSDGITWTQQTNYSGFVSLDCIWSENDQLWAVVHQSGGSSPNGLGVSTSPNGITWTKRDSMTGNRQPQGIAYSKAGDRWCIVGSSDTLVKGLTKSQDAITWTQITTFPISQPDLVTVGYSEILDSWIVAGNSGVYKSGTGLQSWSSNLNSTLTALLPSGSSSLLIFTAEFNNYTWFLLGQYFLGSNYRACLFTSIDGIHWEYSNAGFTFANSDQTFSTSGFNPTLKMYVIAGSQGFLATAIEPVSGGSTLASGIISMNWKQDKK